VELISEAFAHELAPTRAKVTIIEPGVFATEFAAGLHVVAPDVYEPTVGKFLADFAALPPEAFGDAEAVADAITAVTTMENPPLRLAVGADDVDGIRASLFGGAGPADVVRCELVPAKALFVSAISRRCGGASARNRPPGTA
jgi:NAD(P)-dependent dehydrogenase (short-subunit alcohol dehydrogenase family)